MSPDTREFVAQLLVGVLSAALICGVSLAVRRRPPAWILIVSASVVAAASVAIGLVEARLFGAAAAGASIGVVVAGAVVLMRMDRSVPGRGRALVGARARRGLLLAVTAAVGIAPLPAMAKESAGYSVLGFTREAAAGSAGSWSTAWYRSWQIMLEPDHLHLRLSLVISWMVLVGLTLTLVVIVAGRVIAWRTAHLLAELTASVPVLTDERVDLLPESSSGVPSSVRSV